MREPFAEFISRLEPGILLITCGLPGSWKTETAEEVSKIKGYPIIRSDLVRLEVLKGEDVFDEKVASDMGKRKKVYDEVFRRAESRVESQGGEGLQSPDSRLQTPRGDGVILDATFVTQSLRRRAAEIAAKHHRTFVIMQTTCPQEVSIARILRRTKEDYESNALTEQAYFNNKARFEAVDLDDFKQLYPNLSIIHFTVDTRYDPPEEWYIIGVRKMP